MDPRQLFESVRNFSEGSRADVIAELAGAAAPAHVLDVDPDADHNRVVISLACEGHQLLDALFASVQVAIDRIDLNYHHCLHPRVCAADVIAIRPLGWATTASARRLARR